MQALVVNMQGIISFAIKFLIIMLFTQKYEYFSCAFKLKLKIAKFQNQMSIRLKVGR